MKRLLMILVLVGATFAGVSAASARPYYYGGGYRGYYGSPGYYGAYAGPRATMYRGAYGPGYGYGYGVYAAPRVYAPGAYYGPSRYTSGYRGGYYNYPRYRYY